MELIQYLNEIANALAQSPDLELPHYLILGTFVTMITLLFLTLLVRYAIFFAIFGTGAFMCLMAYYPNTLPSYIVKYVLLGALALLVLMMLIYEIILWRQAEAMKSIALKSLSSTGRRPRSSGY